MNLRQFIGYRAVVLLFFGTLAMADDADGIKPGELVEPVCLPYQAPVLNSQIFEDIQKNLGCSIFTSRIGGLDFPPFASSHGKLTTLWAQEEVGADLVREELASWDERHPDMPGRTVSLGVLDVGMQLRGFSSYDLSSELKECRAKPENCKKFGPKMHGTFVGNLMVGDLGTASRAKLTRVDDGARKAEGVDIASAYRRMDAPGPNHPEVVNMSVNEDQMTSDRREALETMSAKTIAVHSAGNQYPKPSEAYLDSTHGIVVGSVSPEGLMSNYSSESEGVTISAPSDYDVTSSALGGGGTPGQRSKSVERFSGTSAAAPIVSGAIANVLSLLPGMTTDEVKVLLRQTAIPTAGFRPSNGRNGAGSLNALGMLMAAKKLKLAGWPSSRDLLKTPLKDASIFNFEKESADFKNLGLSALKKFPCSSQKEAAHLLRKAFFLNPRDPEVRGALAELYRANHLEAQAQFVEGRPAAETLKKMRLPGPKLSLGVRAGVEPKELFPKASDRHAAYVSALSTNDQFDHCFEDLVNRSLRDPDPEVRAAILKAKPVHQPGFSQLVMTRAALDHGPDVAVRAQAMRSACVDLLSGHVRQLLPLALKDVSPSVKQEALNCVSTCRAVFEKDLKIDDEKIKKIALGNLQECDKMRVDP